MFIDNFLLPDFEEFCMSYNEEDYIDRFEELGISSYPIFYGKDNYATTPEFKKWMSENNPMYNDKTKNKHLEIVRSEEYRKKMSEIKTGTQHTEETKKKMSESAIAAGTGTWNLGVAKTEEHKKNISKSALKRPRIICDKCEQGYTKANFKKHHDSCIGKKQNPYKWKKINGKMKKIAVEQSLIKEG